jgi:hypothetical protein
MMHGQQNIKFVRAQQAKQKYTNTRTPKKNYIRPTALPEDEQVMLEICRGP